MHDVVKMVDVIINSTQTTPKSRNFRWTRYARISLLLCLMIEVAIYTYLYTNISYSIAGTDWNLLICMVLNIQMEKFKFQM
jgi:hypothetical protein